MNPHILRVAIPVSRDDPFQTSLVIEIDSHFFVELGMDQVILTSQNFAHHLSEP